jgi:hypothetical protein
MPFGKPQFPTFVPPDIRCRVIFFARLSRNGLRRRYGEQAASMRLQIEQDLNIIGAVGNKCAFRIGHQIRQNMAEVDGELLLSGQIECDETYVGGLRAFWDD